MGLSTEFRWKECHRVTPGWVIHAPQRFPKELLQKMMTRSIYRMLIKDMATILRKAIASGKFKGTVPETPYYPRVDDFYLT